MNINRIKPLLGWIVTIVCLSYFIYYIVLNFNSIPVLDLSSKNFMILLFLLLFHLLSMSLAAVSWSILINQETMFVSNLRLIQIYFRAQFAKFLPGNIAHHIGRVWIAKKYGVPSFLTIQSMIIESAWFISVGTSFSMLFFLFANYKEVSISILKSETIMLILAISLFSPIIVTQILNKFFKNKILKLTGKAKLKFPNIKESMVVLILQTFCFLISGLILNIIAIQIFEIDISYWLFLSCAFALSWLAGYFIPGAPAGIGVREALIVTLLTPIYGAGVSIGISIFFRLVTTLGDFIAFCVSFISVRTIEPNKGD